mmetsp:Transcript_6991/g.11973  ORF Transcript_6991/g.11973 Transcript_6991/m.11973 type:complete len:255 (+) Transcript_6991:1010-1774(+)
MPRTDTSHLAETLVGLARKATCAPSRGHTLVTLALSDADDVNHLVLLEDAGDVNVLLEKLVYVVHLLVHGAAVNLDLHDVSLLLAKVKLAHLGVHNRADDLAVLLNPRNLTADVLGALSPLLGILGEGLLLRLVPVLVEASSALIAQMLSPHRGKRSEATGSFHVADKADNDNRRNLEDCHCLNDLLLVQLGPWFVDFTDDVSHASFVAQEGCEMRSLLWIISRKTFYFPPVAGGTLPGQKAQRTVPWSFELPV